MSRRTYRAHVRRLLAGGMDSVRTSTCAGEEPLEIAIDGEPWLVTMRTPGEDFELVHGLLLAEGIITAAEHVRRMRYGGAGDHEEERTFNLLDVELGAEAKPPTTSRASYVSSACGICGSSADAVRRTSAYPVADIAAPTAKTTLLALPERLQRAQTLFQQTGGTHAAGLFTGEDVLVVREDVGRHNAVDKALGWALQHGRVPLHDAVLQVSGRASFELVQKAAMAGVPVMAAVGAPSTAAIDLADEVGITLAAFSRGDQAELYTRPDRVIPEDWLPGRTVPQGHPRAIALARVEQELLDP